MTDVQAEMIAWGVGQILPDSQIPLRRQNGGVAERQLDLLQGGMPAMRQMRKRPAQIVGSQLPPEIDRVAGDDVEYRLGGRSADSTRGRSC